jgi:hypothetical protein
MFRLSVAIKRFQGNDEARKKVSVSFEFIFVSVSLQASATFPKQKGKNSLQNFVSDFNKLCHNVPKITF